MERYNVLHSKEVTWKVRLFPLMLHLQHFHCAVLVPEERVLCEDLPFPFPSTDAARSRVPLSFSKSPSILQAIASNYKQIDFDFLCMTGQTKGREESQIECALSKTCPTLSPSTASTTSTINVTNKFLSMLFSSSSSSSLSLKKKMMLLLYSSCSQFHAIRHRVMQIVSYLVYELFPN